MLDQVAADREDQRVGARQAPEALQLDAQMHLLADVLGRHRGAVRAPFVVIFRAGVEARVDGHRPVEAARRLALLDVEQEFQRALEDALSRCASGTGACHSKKFMPMSKSSDQSAWVVTMPASIQRLPSRWSRMQKSPWLWRVMYSIGP